MQKHFRMQQVQIFVIKSHGVNRSVPRIDISFGDWVQSVLKERNLGYRQQTLYTGINHVTLMKMASGVVPAMETVIRFARGFGLDVNQVLRRAGYPPVNTPAEYFWIRFGQLTDLCAAHGVECPVPNFRGGSPALESYDAADAALEELRLQLIAEHPLLDQR